MIAGPITTRAGFFTRIRVMTAVAVRMMLHDRLKSIGTLVGVVFATLLANQQAGTFLGLLDKNTMLVANTQADLWIVPKTLPTLQQAAPMSISTLHRAQVTPGVAWAEPLAYGGANLKVPGGGTEQVNVVGARLPRAAGGPWNIVRGSVADLREPGAFFFEDSERAKYGGMNLRSQRELNGRTVHAVGFTWGLIPFGPAYAFSDYDTARDVLGLAQDQVHFVLVGVAPGQSPERVRDALRERIPDAQVLTSREFESKIRRYILTQTAIGVSFGTSTFFGLLVGFVIVALTMFSSVIDNLREFGTLKAIGATGWDLALLLLVQSVLFALLGSLVGLALVSRISEGIRSANLALVLPAPLFVGTFVVMTLMCLAASSLALARVRSVEPGMVFR
ncbi:MAG: FtsX-like permease family protein [Myxococcales bacterium]|nr:FtsX-like permease family protein [Myxococcales bacterium]